MYTRPTTDILQNVPRRSKLRPLSIASITLLQLINSPVLDTLLNGGDIDLSKSLDLLTYLYIHTIAEDKAIELCLDYNNNPQRLKSEVLLWAVSLSDEDFAQLVADLILEKDSIQNSQFEIVNDPEADGEKSKKKSITKRICRYLFGLWHTLLKTRAGKKSTCKR